MRLLLWLAIPALALAECVACSSHCPGIVVDGKCEETCHDELCPSGRKCVNNACATPCDPSAGCQGGQRCEPAVSDYGTKGSFCAGKGSATAATACAASSDCDVASGYGCVSGACTLTCRVHADCGSTGSCTGTATDTEGNRVLTCAPDSFPRGKGQFGASCPNDAPADCDVADGFVCLGAGPGDIDGYCSKEFCASDADCPSGSLCSSEQSGATPCDSVCPGLRGKSKVVGCISSSDIGAGKHYSCGAVSLVAKVCRHRDFCDSCTTDADCLGKPDQICAADGSGNKICTILCDPNVGSCPWGAATECKIWDPDLGVPTCGHLFGSCTGTGKSCEPCVQQTDCPNGYCHEAAFTGERYCVDLSVSCSCPDGTTSTCTGGGCPTSPGGLTMTCYGGSDNDGTPLANRCLGANADQGQRATRESCWPR